MCRRGASSFWRSARSDECSKGEAAAFRTGSAILFDQYTDVLMNPASGITARLTTKSTATLKRSSSVACFDADTRGIVLNAGAPSTDGCPDLVAEDFQPREITILCYKCSLISRLRSQSVVDQRNSDACPNGWISPRLLIYAACRRSVRDRCRRQGRIQSVIGRRFSFWPSVARRLKRDETAMKIGIMGAMPEEISGILDMIDNRARCQVGDRDFWEGTWSGLGVVAAFSRWGKVAAATTAAILISRFHVDHILFIGVAGGVDPDLMLGDVVVASELIQHDMDASAIPMFARFEVPLLGRARFDAHVSAREKAVKATELFFEHDFDQYVSDQTKASFSIGTPKVVTGLIASGDRFVSDIAYLESLRAVLPDLQCVEMEGAAVAQVCFEFSTGITVIRVISDRANHEAPVDFPRFTAEVASVMTKGIAKQFLRLWMQDPSA